MAENSLQSPESSQSGNEGIHNRRRDKKKYVLPEERPIRAFLYPLSPAARLSFVQSTVVLLREQPDIERFTLGLARNSSLILQCLDGHDETWLHQIHATIYFDPDSADAELYNATLSTTFHVSSAEHNKTVKVAPNESFPLRAKRSWAFSVSKGHKFGILLASPPTLDEQYQSLLAAHLSQSADTIYPIPTALGPETHMTKTLKRDEVDKIDRYISFPTLVFENKNTTITKTRQNGKYIVTKKPRATTLFNANKTWSTEIRALRQLVHPNIVSLLASSHSTLSIDLEYIGPSLENLVDREHYFTVTQSLPAIQSRILSHISSALAFLEKQKWVHCDIKPSNILLTPGPGYNRAVLCDFGFARLSSETETYAGTPHYVPLELLTADQRIYASDIWSLGVVMLFVLQLLPLPGMDTEDGWWRIMDIRDDLEAQKKMRAWLKKVKEAALGVPRQWAVVRKMLSSDYQLRIPASVLVEEAETIAKAQSRGRTAQTVPGLTN